MLKDDEMFLLPLDNVVVFPDCATVLTITKKDEINTVEKAYDSDRKIFCVAKRHNFNKENTREWGRGYDTQG